MKTYLDDSRSYLFNCGGRVSINVLNKIYERIIITENDDDVSNFAYLDTNINEIILMLFDNGLSLSDILNRINYGIFTFYKQYDMFYLVVES